jgi:hypothetical protein
MVEIPKEKRWSKHEKEKRKRRILYTPDFITKQGLFSHFVNIKEWVK